MRNPVFYAEQRFGGVKRWTIEDQDIRNEEDAIAYINNYQPDPEENEEDDWDDIVIVDSEPGAFDYKVTLSLLVEAEDQKDAEDIAAYAANKAWESDPAVIESNVLNVEKCDEC